MPSRWCALDAQSPRWPEIWASRNGRWGHWVRRAEEGQMLSEPKTLALETPEQREVRRLWQELEYVSRQRDILKKALGILSAEMLAHGSR